MTKQHVLTAEEQIRGVKAAIASSRTPQQLRAALKARLGILQKKLDSQQGSKARPRKQPRFSVLDWLGF